MEPIIHVVTQEVGLLLEMSSKLNPYILAPICLAVFGLFIGYLRNYQWPAQRIKKQLGEIIRHIKYIRGEHGLPLDEMENRVDCIFEVSPFSHLWAEYRQSLHIISAEDSTTGIKSVLATVPAETYFSKDSLVDLQINADFYRHLPGILTGIGIIGTFSGLVWGLHEFRPDPGQALESLPLLLQEVTSAFIGSGLAILAAIFITYKEKSILNACYRLVEALNKEIDSMHASGAGEEYLARLVRSSESRPAAARAIKETLMEDLSRLMHEITERQITAFQQQNQSMSLQISEAIKASLAEPMAKLSGVVQDVAGSQQENVSGLLEKMLSGFMAKFDNAFGQKIEGINLSLQKSSSTMDRVQDAMAKSIGNISSAGMSATSKMSDRMENSLSRALAVQEQITMQMVQQQKHSSEAMDAAMQSVLAKLQTVLGSLALERSQQIEQDQLRHENLLSSSKTLYSGLSENVGSLVEDIRAAASATGDNVASIQKTALQAISGMQEGAIVMRDAAEKFTYAGNSISGLTDTMAGTATSMQLTADRIRQASETYETTRETVHQHVIQLHGMVDTVRKESAVSRDLVNDMERIVASLADTERQSKEYLDRVNEVLRQSFQDFGMEMVGQVRNISAESNRQLGTSLHALSDTVDSMITSVTKLRRAV